MANNAKGEEVKFSEYREKVLLIVNTATECGLTSQFLELQSLYDKYKESGFLVLGFPSNSFYQEPRSSEEIVLFCNDNFLVNFPIFKKLDVKGENQSPLYEFLTEKQSNPAFFGEVQWNFEKFLIGKNGQILNRFESEITPDDPRIIKSIEEALIM